ncbi:serine/threonine-protein kinase [Kitasatospora camelliae]|uniref:non-specific serine/threonine protein kinase n=1 Tax=Kitasatospora camelliae TaxID=3156397 RepID=A0AAU8JQB1_9ACTN
MNAGGPGPQIIDDRFELLARLGGGGMGLVWRARDTVLHREVALKEVRPPDPAMLDGDSEAGQVVRERVLREARALARLQHANVVVIHHIVDRPELAHPWLVMELVSGGSLHDRLERGPLAPVEAAEIGRGVLSALRAAHAAGIQHRDVKPANVLLRTDGTPVLTDFGIAALRESTSLTATGSLIGSPEFIAPERIRGHEGDPASDLWSLAMMLYVAVEGHHPLRRGTTLATLAAVLDEPMPPPVRCGPLTPVLAAVLQRDPAARPDGETLDRMLADVQRGAPPAGGAWGHASGLPTPTEADLPRPHGPGLGTGTGTGAGIGAGPGAGTGHPGQPAPGTPWPTALDTPRPGAQGSFGMPGGTAPWPTALDTPRPGSAGQLPSGTPWPSGPHTPPPGALVDMTPPWGAVPQPPKRNRLTPVLLAVVLVGSMAAGGVLWSQRDKMGGFHASGAGGGASLSASAPASAPSSGSATQAQGGKSQTAAAPAPAPASARNLLTTEGVQAMIDQIKSVTGATLVTDLTVYQDYARLQVPLASNPKLYDQYDYRGGKLTRSPGGTVGSDKTIDLATINWNALPGLFATAEKDLGVSKPTMRYFMVDDEWFGTAPALRVYITDDYGAVYLTANAKGEVVKTYPRYG